MNAVIRRTEQSPSRRVNRDVHSMLDRFFGPGPLTADGLSPFAVPALDVSETDEAYIVQADMPGVSRDDIEISVHEGELTIAAQAESETEQKSSDEARVLRRERHSRSYRRSLRLGRGIDAEKIEAVYRDGVLSVTLPKAHSARPRRIEIGTT